MKKKIKILLTLVLSVGLLGGCGSSSTSSKEIAFSELLKSDVIIYSGTIGQGDSIEGKDEKIFDAHICGADGTYSWYEIKGLKLGELAQKSDEEVVESISSTYDVTTVGNYKLGILTDSTGNSTETECLLVRSTYDKRWENSKESGWIGYTGGIKEIGNFVGHITVYDTSYMMFQRIRNSDCIDFYLIKDTEETKDKTVYLDAVGTEGIVVDKEAEEAFE